MSKEQFIIAMRFLASSVSVISAKDQSGKLYSMTASSVTSLTIDPPSVLVCVNNSASITTSLLKERIYALIFFKKISKRSLIYVAQSNLSLKDLKMIFGIPATLLSSKMLNQIFFAKLMKRLLIILIKLLLQVLKAPKAQIHLTP